MTKGLMRFAAIIQLPSLLPTSCHDELAEVLHSNNQTDIDAFIAKTQALSMEIETQLHNGRDQLLELNSCRKESADEN